jgi:hypothetical protein
MELANLICNLTTQAEHHTYTNFTETPESRPLENQPDIWAYMISKFLIGIAHEKKVVPNRHWPAGTVHGAAPGLDGL